MAAHSNSSLSPLPSKSINPNPRNPETNSIIRRSFTATNKPSPANSPSEFGGRRCVGRDCEEKENGEKDSFLKGSKLQSPAKGCKNFMAPTISAASKFTPSQRKKVLVDRNEPVRTSISFSDGKAMFFSNENMSASVVETHPISKPCKKVTFSDESVITDSDGVGVESKVVQSPIDVDPCLPPYDPKTNYLSPRPQFIRYKPNPRIEMLLNKDKGMDSDDFECSLMEEMMAEGFSDSDEASADMVIGSDKEIEAVDHVSDSPFLALPIVTAQADKILEEEFVGSDGKKAIDHVSELPSLALPVSTAPADEILKEELVGSDGKKPRRVARSMCFFTVVLVLLVAAGVSVSVTRAPSFDESSLLFVKDLSLSDLSTSSLYEQSRAVVVSAKLNVGRVAASCAALVFKLANELVEGKKQAPVQFMNLSDLQENAWKEAYFLKRVESIEEDEFEEELDSEIEDEAYADEELDLEGETDAFEEEEADLDDYIEKDIDETIAETASDTVIQPEMDQSAPVSLNQETDVETAIETSHMESESMQNIQIQTDMDQSSADPQHQETEMEMEKSQVDINAGASDNAETESSDIALAITCLLAGVAGVAALVYKRFPGSSPKVVQVEQVVPVESKQRDGGVTKSSNTEAMEQAESWQTEMSSSYHERSGGGGEVVSSERKARRFSKRESLASSSGSPSYGSFTTYERIPTKANGYGEEEIMTPVRRSSRIRKKFT
ncbi:uncharacterized protein LOC121758879 [Salvia splendens]|uniref:uncharacterized protein LOC121758879 n=1 Tax=Salvia splendens TaxID=180675 RepID=UPI001C280533|nr:uncharacterized protein LOC121758879 [Salvia splendens]